MSQQQSSVKEYERELRECTKQKWLTGGKQIHARICSTSPSRSVLLFLANTLVRMYAECGCLAQARQLFEAMPRRNVYSWTILISAYSNCQGSASKESLSLFDRMVSEGVAPNQVTFLAALKSCSCLPSLRRLHDSAKDLGLHHNVFVSAALVNTYSKCGSLDEARQVFDSMPTKNVVSWNAMISGYAQYGYQSGTPSRNKLSWDAMISEHAQSSHVKGIPTEKAIFWNNVISDHAQCGLNSNSAEHAQFGQRKDGSAEHSHCWHFKDVYTGHVKDGHHHCAIGVHAQFESHSGMTAGHAQNGHMIAINSGQDQIAEFNVLIAEHVKHGNQDVLIANHALHDDHDAMIAKHAQHGEHDAMISRYTHCDHDAMIAKHAQHGEHDAMISRYTHCGVNDVLIAQRRDHDGMIAKHAHPGDHDAVIDGQVHPGDHDAMIPKHGRIGDHYARYALHGDHDTMISGHPWNGDHDAQHVLHDHDGKLPGHGRIGDHNARHAPCRDQDAMIPGHARIGDHDSGHAHYAHRNTILAGHIPSGHHNAMIFGRDPSRPLHGTITIDAQPGHCNEALTLFEEMQRQGWKPDKVTFISALKASTCIATLEQGKLIHATILKSGFETNDMVDCALIDMYAKCGSIEEARRLFDITSPRDVIVWTTLITGYAQHGHGKRALELFQEMQLDGVKPDEVTFVSVLSACRHDGLVEEARRLFDSITRVHKIELTREHYAGMVDILCRAGHLIEAEELINKMPIQPGASMWRSILGACELHGNVELGRRAFKHVMELEPANTEAVVMLSDISMLESASWPR